MPLYKAIINISVAESIPEYEFKQMEERIIKALRLSMHTRRLEIVGVKFERV